MILEHLGDFARPARWQGWACYCLMLSPFVIIFIPGVNPIIVSVNPIIPVVIFVAFFLIGMTIAMLKSNYREVVREYRENLKK